MSGRESGSGMAALGRPEPLLTYREALNPRSDFDQLERLLSGQLNEAELTSLRDFKLYILKGEAAWVLDQNLLEFVGGLLEHRSLNVDIRVKLVRLLAAAACREDFWSFLQMDRKNRYLMKFPNDFDNLGVEEQKAVALFLCNTFSSNKGSDWLMYSSTWKLDDDREVSNVRITAKVAGYSLVSYTPSLQEYGSALIYNIALKETKVVSVPTEKYNEEGLPSLDLSYGSVSNSDIMTNDGLATRFVTLKVYNDVAAELSMALLKYIKKTKNPPEEILFRCIKSLVKFSHIIREDLLHCIAMVQVDLDSLVPGHSARIDQELALLKTRLTTLNTK